MCYTQHTSLIMIILVCSSLSKISRASEYQEYVRDYTGGHNRVISSCNYSYAYARNDIVDNVLTSLPDSNNSLFVCYSGYKSVSDWTYAWDNSRENPIIKKTTNILTEIGLTTKIEYKFDTPREIDNTHPVNDILRWKNNYCVAHSNNVYIYHPIYSYFRSSKLALQQHLAYNLTDQTDVIKKVFIDSHDNILAISAQGLIFKTPLATSVNQISSLPQNTSKLNLNLFNDTEAKKIHAIAYNKKENLLFFGLTGSVKIVTLDDQPKIFTITVQPNLTISTIDTNSTHLLLSNIVENMHVNMVYFDQHLKHKGCCLEKQIPYEQWQDCDACIKAQEEWQKKPVTLTITANGSDFIQDMSAQFNIAHPKPNPCTHKIAPYNATDLPDSCRNTTILLVTFAQLMQAMQDEKKTIAIDQLQPIKKMYLINTRKERVTQALLGENWLFIGTDYNLKKDVYKFSLYALDATNSELDLAPCQSSDNKKNRFLYYHYDGDWPLKDCYVLNTYEHQRSIAMNKTSDSSTLVLSQIRTLCSAWDQGGCLDGHHHFRRIANTIRFVKNNAVLITKSVDSIIWLRIGYSLINKIRHNATLLLFISALCIIYQKTNILENILILLINYVDSSKSN